MEERRGYICSECKNWINPQDIGDGTDWTTMCEKGLVVSSLSVPCVPKDIYFTSYYKYPTELPKRVKRVKPGRLFSFNQEGVGFVDILFYVIMSAIVATLLYSAFESGKRSGQLDNSVVISSEDLKEIMYQLSENQKQIMALQISNVENFEKIELLERAILASALFEILKGFNEPQMGLTPQDKKLLREEREWTSENASPKEEEK